MPCGNIMEIPTIKQSFKHFSPPLERAGPDPYDCSSHFVLEVVEDFNRSTFQRFIRPLRVWRLHNGLNKKRQYGDQQVVFAVAGKGFHAKVPILIKYKRNSLNLDYTLSVLGPSGLVSLKTWLEALPADAVDVTGRAAYDKQLLWWHSRQNAFHLERLPAELIDLMLLHLMGEVRPLRLIRGDNRLITLCWELESLHYVHRDDLSRSTREIERIDPTVLALNKSLRSIAVKVADLCTVKQIVTLDDLSEIMRQDWGQLFNFPRIQLAMPIRHLLKLFQISFPGANEGRGWTYQPPSFDKLMQKFSGLRYLEIYFESTLDPVGSNPWSVYWHDTDSQVDCAIYPCRKTLVDWIMLFIFPHVQHIASVSLTGFVKNCTREIGLRAWVKVRIAGKLVKTSRRRWQSYGA